MSSTGAFSFSVRLSSVFRSRMKSPDGKSNSNPISISISTRRFAVSTGDQAPAKITMTTNEVDSFSQNRRRFEKTRDEEAHSSMLVPDDERRPYAEVEKLQMEKRAGLKDYFEMAKDFIGSDGGPPRWFSPLEGGSCLKDSPLLLFLPGLDGVGLGLVKHHQRLGEMFNLWCLHIPAKDRTPFTELVKLVERTIISEHHRSPKRPIYLVGDNIGACLALSVAALNPDIDLVLILVNPVTSFSKSQLQLLMPLLEIMPDSLQLNLPYMFSLLTGDSLKIVKDSLEKGLPLQIFGELSRDLVDMSSYLPVFARILPRETILWKLKMLKSASAFAGSRVHAVKTDTLILSSGKDPLLPCQEEGEQLYQILPKSTIRIFEESGHFILLEDDFDLVTVIKGTRFYRRSKHIDHVFDYILPTPYEFKKIMDSNRLLCLATSPVMLSTLENGKIVRGLAGIPPEGPVLFVGYHMLLGFELVPLVSQLLMERNILMRGIAHPMMFKIFKKGRLSELSLYDTFKLMGAVPVSGKNFYKLFSSNSHVLLYPGGMREALHRKGEQYKLFWPEQSEFVRMAVKFGAKIIPFGVVGEDDIGEVVFDYEDQMKIPYLRNQIEELTNEAVRLRTERDGEVANQDVHLPGVLPKFPGRFYYYFGKPIETKGRKQELGDREKSQELYLEVKSEVERCIAYLKEKREKDPYRNLLPRLVYQATHGSSSQVPTFEI